MSILIAATLAAAATASDCTGQHVNQSSFFHLRSSAVDRTPAAVQAILPTWTGGNGGKILGYTRLRATYVDCGGTQRLYQDEKRDPLVRFFLGKETHKTLSLSVKISPLDVKSVSSLARFDRLSNRRGEEWTTNIENDRILLPYFRVDRSTTLDLQSEVLSTREYKSSIVAGSYEVIEKAAALISPSTVLITEENKGKFNEAASFVDSSIDGLLHVSITEKLRETLSMGDNPKELARITLVAPRANDAYPTSRFKERMIGQWIVYAEPLRPSMFTDMVGSARTLKRDDLSASAILNFLVQDQKTLRELLAGTASVTAARDAVIKAPKDKEKATALCRAVSSEADRVGLTPMDASATAWAYVKDMALPTNDADQSCAADLEFYPT